jgi:HPt (histidine-containing phosphotransfer) domain-containing protein
MTIFVESEDDARALPSSSEEDGASSRPCAPIDLKHLNQYTVGDRALERELLSLFRNQSKVYMTNLRDAADQKTWVETAHALKGSATGVGAWAVANIAEEAENGDMNTGIGLLARLESALCNAVRFIDCRMLDAAS